MKLINNALESELAEELRAAFSTAKWDFRNEAHPEMYKEKDEWFPHPDERYKCRYSRSTEFEKTDLFHRAGLLLEPYVRDLGTQFEAFAYKMMPGDFFRVHDDAKNGVGFIYYLSKSWKWDWGGLLMVRHKDSVVSLKPTFNRLVVIDYALPHFVTTVAAYATEPRYAVVGFVKRT